MLRNRKGCDITGRISKLEGHRFGKLTVIERADQREDRYCTWRCRCDCGNEITVNTKRLTRGTVTNCGCVPQNPNLRGTVPMDITGKRFGKLTVLHRESNKSNGRTCWLCQCDCGNQCVVTTHELQRGKTKSCGCYRRELAVQTISDISGQQFGRLTVLYPTKKRDKKGSVYWHCRCECGNELDVTQDSLVYGNYRSCGCIKQEIKDSIGEQLTFVDDTCVEVLKSRKSRRDNTSGFRGITHTKSNTWRAEIGLQNKRYYIGTYKTFEEAVTARLYIEEGLHRGFIEDYYSWAEKASKDREWGKNHRFYFRVYKENGVFYVNSIFRQYQVEIP